jgi:DNA polymerase III subunit beta
MKFTANSIELQRSLTKIGSVIPSKSTMPILENILFTLGGDTLTLTATDLAISLTVTVPVKGVEDGSVAVPAKRLMDTVRSLPDTSAAFAIDTTSNKIRITTDNGEYNLTGEAAKEFPAVPAFKGTSEFPMDTNILRRIIYRTTFAVSSDELRPAMMGVLFQSKGAELRAVATDGHRLVRIIQKQAGATGLKKDIIVPAKALHALGKSVEDGSCTIAADETHIRFMVGSTVLVSRLIDESYPNYESVIPNENTKTLTVKRDEIINSIRRVALYASATTHQVRFGIESNSLRVTAQDIDFGGEAKETVACTYGAEPLEIGFNSTYLLDILSHLDCGEVDFRFSSPTRAGIVAPAGVAGDEDIIMLVMPVRLNS